MLTLSGHLIATNQGQIIIRNNAYLKLNQLYLNHSLIWLQDSFSFIATDVTIDGNQLPINDINLFDHSLYSAKNTYFTDWCFRKIHDNSSLIIENVNFVGDMLVRDSCTVYIKRSTYMLPWLQIPDGSVINTTFPQYDLYNDTVFHFEFNDAVPGVDGINYSINIDTCTMVMWAVDVEKGSNLIISNSTIYGYMHDFSGNDTLSFSGLFDSTYYTFLDVPFHDRT